MEELYIILLILFIKSLFSINSFKNTKRVF